jgi:hypothetical protein
MGELGLLGVTLPETYGCVAASYVAYGLVAREGRECQDAGDLLMQGSDTVAAGVFPHARMPYHVTTS